MIYNLLSNVKSGYHGHSQEIFYRERQNTEKPPGDKRILKKLYIWKKTKSISLIFFLKATEQTYSG